MPPPETWTNHDLRLTALTPTGETPGPAFTLTNRTIRLIRLEAATGVPLRITRV